MATAKKSQPKAVISSAVTDKLIEEIKKNAAKAPAKKAAAKKTTKGPANKAAAKKVGAKPVDGGLTKMQRATDLFIMMKDQPRKDVLLALIDKVGLTKAGANTYHSLIKAKLAK